MDLALIVLKQVFILIAYALAGVIAVKAKLIDASVSKSLSNILIYIISPFMIIDSLNREYDPTVTEGFLLAIAAGTLVIFLFILLGHFVFFRKEHPAVGVERYALAFSNCGFIGIPLISGIFGTEAIIYIVSSMVVFNVLIWLYGVWTLQKGSKLQWKKILINPGNISVAIGLLIYFCQIPIPPVAATIIDGIGCTNSFFSMFTIGVLCSSMQLKSVLTDRHILYVSLCRLVFAPLIAFFAIIFWIPAILPGEGVFVASVLAVVAVMPVALNLPMMCQICDRDDNVGYAGNVVAVSTILCVVTVPLMTTLLTSLLEMWN